MARADHIDIYTLELNPNEYGAVLYALNYVATFSQVDDETRNEARKLYSEITETND